MNVKRILVIRFSSLGDIILLTPVFRELKKQYNDSRIDFLTSSTFESVCNHNPHVSSIITFNRKDEALETKKVVSLLRNNHYDLIIDAHNSIRSRVLLIKAFGFYYWRRSSIVSIDKRSWKRNLLLSLKVNLLKNAVSQRDAYCQLIPSVPGSKQPNSSTELFPNSDDQKRVKAILHDFCGEGKLLVGLGPGASFTGKCWPKEKFLALSSKLQEMGAAIVLLGGKNDTEAFWIESRCHSPLLNVAGKLTYLETAAMLRECRFSISNDSAIVHFSEAMGTPSIAIFGPTAKEFGYGPFLPESRLLEVLLNCRPCSRNGKGVCQNPNIRQCLNDISVDMVFSAARELMDK